VEFQEVIGTVLYIGGELCRDAQGLIVSLISNLQLKSDSCLDTAKGVVLILLRFAVGSQRSLVRLRLGVGFTGQCDPDDATGTGWSVVASAWTAGLGQHDDGMQRAGQGMATAGRPTGLSGLLTRESKVGHRQAGWAVRG
jgi:hypothetical protein